MTGDITDGNGSTLQLQRVYLTKKTEIGKIYKKKDFKS